MLSIYGRDEAIRNIYKVVKAKNPTAEPQSFLELRQLYLDFLDAFQKGIKTNRSSSIFVEDAELEQNLAGAFSKGMLDDLDQSKIIGDRYDDAARRDKSDLAARALASVMALDDDFATVFSLAIHAVFFRPSRPGQGRRGSHGGSANTSIGSIWLSVEEDVREVDLMEMFVHELTHHLIFIDEFNHPQFNYREIAKQQNYAYSAILRKHRPLDKVVHSIVVATEILEARRKFLGHERTSIHPPTDAMVRETLSAVSSFEALPNLEQLVTPRVCSIVDRCKQVCEGMQN